MKPFRFPAPACVLALAAAVLSGCATYVEVRHPWVLGRVPAADVPRLRRLLVVVERPAAAKPAGFAGSLLGQALGGGRNARLARPLYAAEEEALLEALAAWFTHPWARVVGRQALASGGANFAGALGATAVLLVAPGPVEAAQERVEREMVGPDGKVTGVVVSFVQKAAVGAAWRLVTWPEGRELARGRTGREEAGETPEAVDLEEWTAERGESLLDWAGDVARAVLPFPAVRRRRVREGGKTPLDREWAAGLERERAGDWQGASAGYRTALGHAKKGERRELEGYLAELALMAGAPPPPVPAAATAWFDQPVAVLPFANDTNNVAAPEELRAAAAARLRAMGYRVVPLDAIDRALRGKGVTLGEHLATLKPEEVAAAAGAEKLVIGKAAAFGVVNVGVYYRREVRVLLEMKDAAGRTVWASVGEEFRELASDRPGETFIGGLVGGLFEKSTRQYLREETRAAVMRGLATLPGR